MQSSLSYSTSDLTDVERRVVSQMRELMGENKGRGYGEVKVTIKEGRIVTIRREHIEQVTRKE